MNRATAILLLTILAIGRAPAASEIRDTTGRSVATSAAKPDSAGGQRRAADGHSDTILILKGTRATVDSAGSDQSVESRVQAVVLGASKTADKTRHQGFGLSGGFSPFLAAFRMAPVFDLVHRSGLLSGKHFPELNGNYQAVLMLGGMGYLGIGNGVRIGGGGWGGTIAYASDPYPLPGKDSTATVSVHSSWGGVLLEKALIRGNLNILLGGMWAFGSLEVTPDFFKTGEPSGFLAQNDPAKNGSAKASFTGLELHAGATYTIFPWLHLGCDLNGLFYLSSQGFSTLGSNGFFGVSPGLRLRLLLGNLG